MTEILTRTEAAEYLSISVRQLSRLEIPRHYIGRSPRYLKDDLLTYLAQTRISPKNLTPYSGSSPKPLFKPENNYLNSPITQQSISERIKELMTA